MSERPPSLSHRAEHAAVLAAVGLAAALPGRRAREGFARAMGALAHGAVGIRRDLAEANLRIAFPDAPDEWIRRTARACYTHLAREMLVVARLGRMDADEVRERTRVTGLEEMRAAVAEGRGVVLFTGHFGNWEMGGAALAVRGVPLDVVAQRQRNPLVDRMIMGARHRSGLRIIDRSKAAPQGLRALRQGRVVGFLADQDARGAGVFVPFFGRPASTHRGAAILALRSGAPVFIVTAVRAGEGYDVALERVGVDREGPTDEVVVRITAAVTARLEEAVRRHPEQYLWLHKRWKTRPPQERDGAR